MHVRLAGSCAAKNSSPGHIGMLWNPHASITLQVYEFGLTYVSGLNDQLDLSLGRATTRGAASSAFQCTRNHSLDYSAVPPSGAELISGANTTTNPTFSATERMFAWLVPLVGGCGVLASFPEPISVPPGTGLVAFQYGGTSTSSPSTKLSFAWSE